LCDILSERGLDFRATDMEGADRGYLPAGAEFVASDLTDYDSLRRVAEGVQVVLHTAAVFDWWAPRELLDAVNVRGMENLCRACVDAGVRRLVSWSTSGVYGKLPPGATVIDEDTPRNPLEDYSKTKFEQDEITHRFNGRGGLTTSIVRPGIVYGTRAKYGAAQIFDAVAAAPVMPIPVNFKYRLGTVHVRDIGGAALFVSGREEAAGQEYCVVDCSGITMADFIKLVARAMGKPVAPVLAPPQLVRQAGLMAADVSEWIARNVTKSRPLIERGPIQFFPVDLNVSNKKLLDLGYEFEHPTPERAVEEIVAWMGANKMLNINPLQLIRKIKNKK
jgi:nucleoside-diphosphate-sugar epimerase